MSNQAFVICEPNMTHQQEVDFRVRRQPAKSVPLYASMASQCWSRMENTMRGLALRYWASRFNAAHARSVGLAMKLQMSFAA